MKNGFADDNSQDDDKAHLNLRLRLQEVQIAKLEKILEHVDHDFEELKLGFQSCLKRLQTEVETNYSSVESLVMLHI